ncbi:MAG: ABC transporter ATP-binding protein, partial [Acidimicrobiia bacterium]
MSRARLDPDARPDLVVDSLEAGYGQIRVLRGISLRVAAGERVALIGANGAGKTTLLRCIAGLLRAGAGTVTFGEVNLQRVPAHRLVRLGVVLVPEGRQVFTRQSVHANLMLGARTRRDRLEVAEHLDRVFEVFPVLRARSGSRAGELSGGQQQMLALG